MYKTVSTIYTSVPIRTASSKTKTLKRNAYGHRNFRRFRNRILYILSHLTQKGAV